MPRDFIPIFVQTGPGGTPKPLVFIGLGMVGVLGLNPDPNRRHL